MNNQDTMHQLTGLAQYSVLSGDRQPEEAVKNEIRNIINNYVIPGMLLHQDKVLL